MTPLVLYTIRADSEERCATTSIKAGLGQTCPTKEIPAVHYAAGVRTLFVPLGFAI